MAPDSFMGPGYRQEITHNCADGRGVYRIPVQNQTCFTVQYTITEDANEHGNKKTVFCSVYCLIQISMDAQLSAPMMTFRCMGSSLTIFCIVWAAIERGIQWKYGTQCLRCAYLRTTLFALVMYRTHIYICAARSGRVSKTYRFLSSLRRSQRTTIGQSLCSLV